MMISPKIRCPIFVVLAVGLLISSCGKPEGEGQTVISGKALAPLAEATLFAYREGADLKGPPFAQSQPSAADGGFSLALPPGKYMLVLRKREGGETTGPVRTGDYKSEIVGPVTVRAGGSMALDFVALKKSAETKDLPAAAATAPTKTGISGVVSDSDGKPVVKTRVHAYTYPQMSERPKYVSEETGADGRYILFFPEGGTYYLAARNRFGGPPRIGELYGRYDDGTVEPSAIHVKDGEILENVDITVHKIW